MSDKRRFSDMDQRSGTSATSTGGENPPYSRLFIVCSKSVTEDVVRDEFGQFGPIEEVWIVKDRATGEHKGIVYVKFTLTSAAAKAIEEMNGKQLGGIGRPIKVLISNSKGEGSRKEPLEEERVLRLFVVIKKDATQDDLFLHFKQFGQVEHVKLVKNRESNENKGFAYIKYYKMSHAALAYENCDRSYRAKFAEPKPVITNRGMMPPNDMFDAGVGNQLKMSSKLSMSPSGYGNESGPTRLQVLVSPVVTQEQLWRLCDVAPGMEFCRIYSDYRIKNPHERVSATVTYSNPAQAAHAREKLNGLEYPPGFYLSARVDRADPGPAHSPSGPSIPPFPMGASNTMLSKSDIEMLAENVKQATALIKATAAGFRSPAMEPPYCTAKLPEHRDWESEESSSDGPDARVFVVFNPMIPERHAIKDVFSRFGRVLDIFLLNSKNVGYVTFAKKQSVTQAIAALHGKELCGQFMKVMEAKPRRGGSAGPDDDRRKRIRMGEDDDDVKYVTGDAGQVYS